MNVHQNLSHFCYQDFLIVPAEQDAVVLGLIRHLTLEDKAHDLFSGGHEGQPLWRRIANAAIEIASELSGVDEDINDEDTSYRIHRGVDAEGEPITHKSSASVGAERTTHFPGWDDIRVSCIGSNPPLTLVEHRDIRPGAGALAERLSKRLPQQDILFVRRSGPLADVHQHDFQVWRDGKQTRRVSCHQISGETEWRASTEGRRSRYEPGAIYVGVNDPRDTLNQAKIDQILMKLGVTADGLFARGARRSAVLLSRHVYGGEPIDPRAATK